MSTVYVKLNIEIELYSYDRDVPVASGTTSKFDTHKFVKQLSEEVHSHVKLFGFQSEDDDTHISKKHGGYSLYQTYVYPGDSSEIRLVIDVRVSDHPSKPDLKTSNDRRIHNIHDSLDASNVEVLDIYCKEHNKIMYIYFGKGKNYAKPLTSVEHLKSILTGKLTKLVNKYGV